jgi:hypothetical protein
VLCIFVVIVQLFSFGVLGGHVVSYSDLRMCVIIHHKFDLTSVPTWRDTLCAETNPSFIGLKDFNREHSKL